MGIQSRLDEQKRQWAEIENADFATAKAKAIEFTAPIIAKYSRGEYDEKYVNPRVKQAKNRKELEEAVRMFFSREYFGMVNEGCETNRLAAVLNHQSGDSWNGTHDRSIEVSAKGDTVTVKNTFMGSAQTETFSKDELKTLGAEEVVKFTRYYEDYTWALERAAAPAPKAAGIRIEVGAFVSEIVDNGKDMTVRLTHMGQPLALNVEKLGTMDIRPQDGIKFVFDAASGMVDKEEGVTFYRNMEPIAKAKFTR